MKHCILYHSSCYDGFGAAFAAWKEFKEGAIYLPCSYGFDPPEEVFQGKNDTIFILDFSFDEKTLLELKNVCNRVVLIDHHKTAQEKLEPLKGKYDWLDIHFDMNKSGALMAWEYFQSDIKGRVPYNELIAHISDRDLWKFEMEGTEEVHKALVSYPMDFKLWDNFNVEELKKEGTVLKRMYDQLISGICDKMFIGTIAGYEVPMVNTTIAWSEVGNELCKRYFAYKFAASFTVFEDQVMWSLRSIGDFDVSEIAKKFGGGGHKNAAGFKTPRY